jgi:arylsulfatase A-like enzyme
LKQTSSGLREDALNAKTQKIQNKEVKYNMGWKEVEAARSRIVTEKREARQWRDDEIRKEEKDRKVKHSEVEQAHKNNIEQIRQGYAETCYALDGELARLVAESKK